MSPLHSGTAVGVHTWKSSNTGWLVYEDEQCIVLAARMTDDGKHAGLVERIPKAAITSRTAWSSTGSIDRLASSLANP